METKMRDRESESPERLALLDRLDEISAHAGRVRSARREARAQMQINAARGVPFAEQMAAIAETTERIRELASEREALQKQLREMKPADGKRERLDWNEALGELLERVRRIEDAIINAAEVPS